MRTRTIAAAALLAAPLAFPTAAEAAALSVAYDISLAGFSIGSAELRSVIDGASYRNEVNGRLTGLAGAFTSGKGGATSSGSVNGSKPVPASFAATSRSSNGQVQLRMGLNAGNVAAVDITPPLEPRPDRVAVEPGHKRGVVDPLSALLMPVTGKGEPLEAANCNRTIPVFDGASRFDIVLSFAGTREVEKPGYRGPVLVCNVRYVPISGHRSERPGTKFMAENRDISVWLAPIAGTRLLVPLRASVATMIGVSVVEAQNWSFSGEAARPQRRARAE